MTSGQCSPSGTDVNTGVDLQRLKYGMINHNRYVLSIECLALTADQLNGMDKHQTNKNKTIIIEQENNHVYTS
jgi:hypothetical protein